MNIIDNHGNSKHKDDSSPNYRPTVLMHGLMGDIARLENAQQWIEDDFPGMFVVRIEIGNGRLDSLFMDINDQVANFAEQVANIPQLANGFNLIGHSQGGLIARAFIERYNYPPVYNYISWAGPQQGVYGVPLLNALCPDQDCPWLGYFMNLLLNGGWADQKIQQSITFASYWKDPYNYTLYLQENIFLADINNERSINETYRQNILSLNSILLTYATEDEIVIPKESPYFYFFEEFSDTTLVPFNESLQYTDDLIGLRTMYDAGKVAFHSLPCGHMQIIDPICKPYYELYTRQYLNNTLN